MAQMTYFIQFRPNWSIVLQTSGSLGTLPPASLQMVGGQCLGEGQAGDIPAQRK